MCQIASKTEGSCPESAAIFKNVCRNTRRHLAAAAGLGSETDGGQTERTSLMATSCVSGADGPINGPSPSTASVIKSNGLLFTDLQPPITITGSNG